MAKGKQSALDRIKGASASKGGNYFKPGKGRLVVKEVKESDTYDGAAFIAEFEVVTSKAIGNDAPNPPGSTVSLVCMLEKFESAAGTAKAFILELFGKDEDEVGDDEFESTYTELVGEGNPARGMVIDYETIEKTAKKTGTKLTLPRFTFVEQTEEQIAAMRAKLDGKAGE